MKEWFATLIDDLKFLGSEVKREFGSLETIPDAEVKNNAQPPVPVYIPFDLKCPGTNIKFYRH
ncbi:hypothetical protein [Escherichia coli]|uniref:hypothetical protein n=1 Tax=Escherichia coli TaxID=562 RepID=UPI0002A27CA6|nr:hypothetical protein [Escherichia coli]ELF04881.1 hypothetical protein A1Y7_04968 [Escherichia coli KTE119]MCV8766056.1 hypothetical protein [Escherichia coli]RCC18450.1 hypothetical protein C6B15_19475 [Escherichia coli]RCC36866.1 hypothetical protein C6B05_20105 [Escherichia coli]RCC47707.1 hypothetical protein C6B07_20725 [Escherichia coli]